MNKLKPGDQVWIDFHYDKPHYATIEKVGRKWATMKGNGERRINIATLNINVPNLGNWGRAYLSREEWEREIALHAAWCDLGQKLYRGGRMPEGMTLSRVELARMALFGSGDELSAALNAAIERARTASDW